MNNTNRENLPESAERLLKETAQAARVRLLIWESLTLICYLAVGFWLTALGDWLTEPGRFVRLAVLVCLAVWFARQFRRRFWFAWRNSLSRKAAAELCQKYFPVGAQEFVTAAAPAEAWDELELPDSETESGSRTDRSEPQFGLWPQVLQKAGEYADRILSLPWRRTVFDRRRFFSLTVLTVLLLGSIVVLGAIRPNWVQIWFQRVVCLSNVQWPRQVRIWVDGFENRNNPVGTLRIVRGDDLKLKVWADTSRPTVPERVTVSYRDGTGRFVRAAMVRNQGPGGQKRSGTGDKATAIPGLEFTYIIRGVLDPLLIDFRGGDATLNDLTIAVVDSPIVAKGELVERFAAYLQRKDRSYAAGGTNRAAEGSSLQFVGWGNKPLKAVRGTIKSGDGKTTVLSPRFVESKESKESKDLGTAGLFSRFELDLGVCNEDFVLTIDLTDQDGLESRRSAVYRISAIADRVPELGAQPKGLGVACTKEARIPFAGPIQDDNGIAAVRLSYEIIRKEEKKSGKLYRLTTEGETPSLSAGKIQLDWSGEFRPAEIPLEWGDLVTLTVEATDGRNLKTVRNPDCGQSAPLSFEVVTPERMRMILEASELNLRRQFETVFDEFRSTRELLATIQTANQTGEASEKPSEKRTARADEFQILHADRTVQNVGKNSQEFLAIAEGFEDLVDQMVNNLVDTPEWKQRLSEGIARPLEKIARETLPKLQQNAVELRKSMENGQADEAARKKKTVQTQFDEAVAQLDAVLGKMLQMEDFNEAIELLRQIIERQEGLETGIKKKQKQSLEDL